MDLLVNLMCGWPCIVIQYGIRNQLDVTLSYPLFLLYKLLNMFWATMWPSSGADDCVVLSPRVGIVPWLQEGCQNWLAGSVSIEEFIAATARYQHVAITLRSRQLLKMGTWLPETCWATCKGEIKDKTKWHLVGFLSHTGLISVLILVSSFLT